MRNSVTEKIKKDKYSDHIFEYLENEGFAITEAYFLFNELGQTLDERQRFDPLRKLSDIKGARCPDAYLDFFEELAEQFRATPGLVDIRFVMVDGTVPDDTTIAAVTAAVNQRGKRPLTDQVQVKKPEIEEYSIDVTYYINTSDSNAATAIQAQAETAVEEYKLWQASKVGRDINPDELIARLNDAGAKRAVVRSPAFRIIGETAKAQCTRVNVVYGGLEND